MKSFADSNLLVYAFDPREPGKQRIAQGIVAERGPVGGLTISTQVIQEFFAALTGKLRSLVAEDVAQAAVETLFTYPVVVNDPPLIRAAIHRRQRDRLSFWDSLVIESALSARCDELLTEDLQHGRRFDSLTVHNPFL